MEAFVPASVPFLHFNVVQSFHTWVENSHAQVPRAMLRAIVLSPCVLLLKLGILLQSTMPSADAVTDPVAETVKIVALPCMAADAEGVAAQCGLWIF